MIKMILKIGRTTLSTELPMSQGKRDNHPMTKQSTYLYMISLRIKQTTGICLNRLQSMEIMIELNRTYGRFAFNFKHSI